jgi:hypothetical protein
MITDKPFTVLSASSWRERSASHRVRAERHTGPARSRRDRGMPHPILDFLFEYYPFSFALLEKWHPGVGVALEWEAGHPSASFPAPFTTRCYSAKNGCLAADTALLAPKQVQRLARIQTLLEATHDRPPNFACHGLHEWAMVYRGKDIRHGNTLPLRLPQVEIDALLESRTVCCSHHDAFRFFARDARPLNHLQPSLETREQMEQPGCLHANMDLYKWAAKAMPWVGTEILLDSFELAVDLRDLDMRASPYDLSDWNRMPVPIETPDGICTYQS